jgi:hypothetical protein
MLITNVHDVLEHFSIWPTLNTSDISCTVQFAEVLHCLRDPGVDFSGLGDINALAENFNVRVSSFDLFNCFVDRCFIDIAQLEAFYSASGAFSGCGESNA